MGFVHAASVIAGQGLKEFNKVTLFAFSEWNRLELPVAIRILIATLNVKANNFGQRSRTAVVKVRRSQLDVAQ